MASGFVSGGTNDRPTDRDDEWLKAQEAIEAARRNKLEAGKQEGGKSLYEVLQQNKTAKQEAFEESIRLKNQFRSLDEDEVEFLDSVLESTRAKEAEVKRDTSEQLEQFRRQREEADKALLNRERDTADSAGAKGQLRDREQWGTTARKRRKGRDTEVIRGVKLRKSSSAGNSTEQTKASIATALPEQANPGEPNAPTSSVGGGTNGHPKSTGQRQINQSVSPKAASNMAAGLGLGDYNSDDDD